MLMYLYMSTCSIICLISKFSSVIGKYVITQIYMKIIALNIFDLHSSMRFNDVASI